MLSLLTTVIYIILFYIAINLGGALLEKIRIPKIYTALFLGIAISGISQAQNFVSGDPMKLLGQAGMFSLLFLLGYGLNLNELRQQSKLVIKVTAAVISSETIVGVAILHFIFGVGWFLSLIIGLSFSTIGEVALLPILDEFKLTRTKLGQTILGVAVLDDIVEIALFLLLLIFIGGSEIGQILNTVAPILAITAGVIFGGTSERSEKFDKALKTLAYSIVGPFFFFSAGMDSNLQILVDKLPLIILLALAIKLTKITAAYFASHKELGTKKSIVLGISTAIKFSTSIIILIILLQKGLISEELFSILIGMKVVFKIAVPLLLSYLLATWRLHLVDVP